MKKINLSLLLIFLISCTTQQTIIVKDKNDYCFLFPNDNSKCNCLEYEKRKQINYSILEKSCISINLKNEAIIKFRVVTEEQLVNVGEMRQYNVHVQSQRPLRNINFSFMENGLMYFEFGGEYKSVQINNQIVEHSSNLTNLYYYIETNNCINATAK